MTERTHYVRWTIIGTVVGLVALVALMFLFPAYSRYQKRADAQNQVKVSAIQIQNQEQRVKIAKQHAQIRYQNSIGIREAQDEIAKTLTPLYVQFEMTQALQAIATSGKNNSVIYIPTSPTSGLPVVPTSNTTPPVTK
jgi:head-tail adaptor